MAEHLLGTQGPLPGKEARYRLLTDAATGHFGLDPTDERLARERTRGWTWYDTKRPADEYTFNDYRIDYVESDVVVGARGRGYRATGRWKSRSHEFNERSFFSKPSEVEPWEVVRVAYGRGAALQV